MSKRYICIMYGSDTIVRLGYSNGWVAYDFLALSKYWSLSREKLMKGKTKNKLWDMENVCIIINVRKL